ncbi:type II toxin-antitoxin system HipA family toxin, partial [Rhizobium ruizarguesonis]
LTYLLKSGSDGVGAFGFRSSETEGVPRRAAQASLDELREAAALIEKGVPLTPALELALKHDTQIGGARTKALINEGTKK